MDKITSAIALVIDSDPEELEATLTLARNLLNTSLNPRVNVPNELAHRMRAHINDAAGHTLKSVPKSVRKFAHAAIEHMCAATDWCALAQHYVDAVTKGTPAD